MVGAFVVPIGLFIIAWTSYSHIHWIAPIMDLQFMDQEQFLFSIQYLPTQWKLIDYMLLLLWLQTV